MKAADFQEAERFHAGIAETTDMDRLRWTRSTIAGLIAEASDDDDMQRLVALIDTRNRIDRRLSELENPASCNSRTPASRKTPHRRPRRICRIGKPAVILHLGDWDPSGEAIFDAVAEDVAAFVVADRPWATITVRFQRVALTGAQVEAYRLPTAPPKASDSRSKGWRGETCQLEALAPDVIAGILKDAIASLLDEEKIQGDRAAEVVERRHLALALPAPGGA